jgi:hypothetical protein
VTAPWPAIDPSSVTLALDDGELELRGRALAGLRVRWRSTAGPGETTCDASATDQCRAIFDPEHPLDLSPGLTWLPDGAAGTDGELVFDADGRPSAAEQRRLLTARTALSMLVRPDAVIDAFTTGGVVPLRHADLIAAIDCAPANCVIDGGGLLVSNVPVGATSVAVHVKLASHVALRRGDAVETAPVLRIPVVRCPLAVVSGPPLRGVDAQTVVVEIDGRCAAEADHLRFMVSGVPVERGAIQSSADRAFAAIRIGRTDADAISISAMRDQGDDAVSALVRIATRAAPGVRVSLELPTRGAIDFVPTNVDAVAHATAADWDGTVRVAPIDGVYLVASRGGDATVRGTASAGGLVALRVELRRALPVPVGEIAVTTIAEPVERPIHEASTAAPLLDGRGGPLAELLCDTGDGVTAIDPGALAHVPFDHHDSCRLLLHRERIDPAMGRQRLALELDVTRVDGSARAEARMARTITLAHGDAPRTLWLRGAESRFDHYTLRLSQSDDDTHQDGDGGDELPSAQWSVVTGRGRARIYATSAIPTGLYRVSDRDHSGILTLNFGVLARLTWLDSLGREGIVAAEGGVLTVGLANDTSATGKSLTQIATVFGVGLSVPIANRALAAETSVNLHAWIELEPSRALGQGQGDAWAFVFGPSITVGNLGADL